MSVSPYMHKFSTDRGFYIYDVNTSEILKASKIEYDLVQESTTLTAQELCGKWRHEYDGRAIEHTLTEIELWKNRGLVSSLRPSRLSYPVDEDLLPDLLDSRLEQLILNITETCNMRCRYCTFSGTYPLERRHSAGTMEEAVARKAVCYFWRHSRRSEKAHISFYGGEPLTCFNRIRCIVEYAKSLQWSPELSFHLDTNGTLLTDESMWFLVKNKIFLQVSLDGPKEVHDKYRVYKGGRGSFEDVMANLERLRTIDPTYFQRHVVFAATVAPPCDLLKANEFFCSDPHNGNNVSPNFVDPTTLRFSRSTPPEGNHFCFQPTRD